MLSNGTNLVFLLKSQSGTEKYIDKKENELASIWFFFWYRLLPFWLFFTFPHVSTDTEKTENRSLYSDDCFLARFSLSLQGF
jgi:hypothetical protein